MPSGASFTKCSPPERFRLGGPLLRAMTFGNERYQPQRSSRRRISPTPASELGRVFISSLAAAAAGLLGYGFPASTGAPGTPGSTAAGSPCTGAPGSPAGV